MKKAVESVKTIEKMTILIIIKKVVPLLIEAAKDSKTEGETLIAVEILVEIKIIVEAVEVLMIFVETGILKILLKNYYV